MQKNAGREAELLVWTDVNPAHEDDFNRWYDREHMAERVAIEGFRWARRYRATNDSARRYLALYRAASVDTFTSASYKKAFEQQTDWSYRNFERMRNTKRRVSTLALEAGVGSGGAVALITLTAGEIDNAEVEPVLAEVVMLDGVFSARAMEPDSGLSTPLPSEDLATRKLEALILIEASSSATATAALSNTLETLGLPAERGMTFSLLWDLHADDLTAYTAKTTSA